MFTGFPKTRPELPDAYRAIYEEHYRRNREGLSRASSLSQKMERWMHRMVAEGSAAGLRTLEVGAGNLNHVPYEAQSPAYDVVEPIQDIVNHSPRRDRVRNVYRTIGEIGNSNGAQYDRILSIAAFEHFCDLPAVVAQCGLLLAAGGEARIAIPSEGTILWRLGWMLTTGLEFRIRYGLDYGVLMRHEHVNSAEEVGQVLQTFFKDTHRKVRGISPSLSFYQFFECRTPDQERCKRYLESRSPSFD